MQTASQKPQFGVMRGGSAVIMKSVYSTLFLDSSKSGKISISVKNVANSRCLWEYMYSVISKRKCVSF